MYKVVNVVFTTRKMNALEVAKMNKYAFICNIPVTEVYLVARTYTTRHGNGYEPKFEERVKEYFNLHEPTWILAIKVSLKWGFLKSHYFLEPLIDMY